MTHKLGWGDIWGRDYGNTGEGEIAGSPSLDYYKSLVTSQYQTSPKMMAMVEALIMYLNDASSALDAMATIYFDIDNAEGNQLDVLGVLVGQSRTVTFQPSNGVSPILDDDTYRLLLKARIAQNQWDGKVGSLYAIWADLFPTGRIIISDSQAMSAVISIYGSFSSIIVDLINNGYIVPRPQGVQYTFDYGTLPFFGYDRNNAFIAGYDTGHYI